MIRYKDNVIELLKNAGYNTNYLRQNKIFGQGTLQYFRQGKIVSGDSLNTLCKLLNCQPGDLLEYVSDEVE